MINNKQSEKLMANWGSKADALACYAEVRVFDPLSPWECYIYAQNPDYPDEIACIVNGFEVEAINWLLSELASRYNSDGEPVIADKEYRPKRAAELFKQLSKGKYDTSRN